MERRDFLTGIWAIGALALFPAAAAAAPFSSNRISVTVQGSGPDVILIPGLTASRAVWKGLVAALPGYRYHLVQVAGFAGTAAGGNAKGPVIAPLAAEIARYIAASSLRSPALIGHSMGGTLAMMIAAHHPARVGRVMAVDILPAPAGILGASATGIRPLADSLRNIFTTTPGGRRLFGSLLDNFSRDDPKAPRSDPDVVARAAHDLAVLDLTDELATIKAPMTILYATPPPGSSYDPARISRDYQVGYAPAKTAKLKAVPNSGHMIMYDQPARFAAEVKAFLAG